MPVTNIPTITPLSRDWTHEEIVSEVMVLTNTIDNEQIQLYNIRNHLNSNLSYLAKLLNLSSSPWYRLALTARIESSNHPSGLDWINLVTPVVVGGTPPNLMLMDIHRISVPRKNYNSTGWVGNCTKLDIAELTQLKSFQNVQWRYSVAWTYIGQEVLLFVGDQIMSWANANPLLEVYSILGIDLVLWVTRKPILDDLLAPDDPRSNYRQNVDLPDQYIDLLVKITQKKVLEQRREQIPTALEQEVNQGLASIQQMLANDLQFEAAEREKRKYGVAQRSPGAV